MNKMSVKIDRELSLGCIFVAVAMLGMSRSAGQADYESKRVRPEIIIKETPIANAVQNLARVAAINYIFDPQVSAPFSKFKDGELAGPIVNGRWTNVTAGEALDKLLAENKLMMITNPVTTVGRIVSTNQGVKPITANQLGTDTNQVMPLIRMEDVALPTAIANLAKQAGLKAFFDSSLDHVSGNPLHKPISTIYVSFRWEKLTAKQALVALLDNYDLMMAPGPNSDTIAITARKPAEASPQGK